PPDAVTLLHDKSAVLVSLAFRGGVRRIVIKRLSDGHAINSPAELMRIHETVRGHSAVLADSIPRILAYCTEHNFVVMEHVEGPTLLQLLTEGAGRHEAEDASTPSLLVRQAGKLLAELHQITPTTTGTAVEPRQNGTYVEHWTDLWKSLGVGQALPARFRDP